ncbi:E3 ubiquitin-protein ligase Rnf220 [Frankliniella fusca]|uniref:E3 ubiquitin-protein ligase Rnf220 n=1 Tax=Frankliniella fusca TaxID=407009 RepID=A0AAE1HY56_9NEOP|nr:E3 ubiquitin-protein ligase Rnf220 [Frankliniella fusca]
MENSAYAPNPLPPPALVVFSQAGGLPEALRMQRPFNPQTPDVKDLHIPFSTSGFGLRHMDGYPGLPAHLLHHLQPQFLHPALDPRLPFGSGAFRPLGSSPHEGKGFASAFAPPSKCLKIETSNGTHEATLFSPGAAAEERPSYMNGQPQQQRSDSSSPASVSVSPPTLQQVVKEESSDAPMSEDRDGTATPGSEGTERSTPEEGRGFRMFKCATSCLPCKSVQLNSRASATAQLHGSVLVSIGHGSCALASVQLNPTTLSLLNT